MLNKRFNLFNRQKFALTFQNYYINFCKKTNKMIQYYKIINKKYKKWKK